MDGVGFGLNNLYCTWTIFCITFPIKDAASYWIKLNDSSPYSMILVHWPKAHITKLCTVRTGPQHIPHSLHRSIVHNQTICTGPWRKKKQILHKDAWPHAVEAQPCVFKAKNMHANTQPRTRRYTATGTWIHSFCTWIHGHMGHDSIYLKAFFRAMALSRESDLVLLYSKALKKIMGRGLKHKRRFCAMAHSME